MQARKYAHILLYFEGTSAGGIQSFSFATSQEDAEAALNAANAATEQTKEQAKEQANVPSAASAEAAATMEAVDGDMQTRGAGVGETLEVHEDPLQEVG